MHNDTISKLKRASMRDYTLFFYKHLVPFFRAWLVLIFKPIFGLIFTIPLPLFMRLKRFLMKVLHVNNKQNDEKSIGTPISQKKLGQILDWRCL